MERLKVASRVIWRALFTFGADFVVPQAVPRGFDEKKASGRVSDVATVYKVYGDGDMDKTRGVRTTDTNRTRIHEYFPNSRPNFGQEK